MMHSFTLASLGFLGLQLNAVCGFLVPVPAQAAVSHSTRNMRSTSSALDATVGTSEWRAAISHIFVRWGRYRYCKEALALCVRMRQYASCSFAVTMLQPTSRI